MYFTQVFTKMILTIKPVFPCTATSSVWTVEFRRSRMGLLMTIQVRSDDVLGIRETCKGRCEDDDKSRAECTYSYSLLALV